VWGLWLRGWIGLQAGSARKKGRGRFGVKRSLAGAKLIELYVKLAELSLADSGWQRDVGRRLCRGVREGYEQERGQSPE
jgi:hypothetical protein